MEKGHNAPGQNFLNKGSEQSERPHAPCDAEQRWLGFDFKSAERLVRKLQGRIGKALLTGEFDKVLHLQNLIVHSYSAKKLAVKIVTTNKGKYTRGIDNVLWLSNEDKYNATLSLNRRGYVPRPLRRIYIPKRNGKVRPLSIPTMKDRAMQTLYKFALEPISELLADEHSYGFRPNLSTRDALIRCHNILYNQEDYKWVLKADVESCFDNINHEWIMENIPIDKEILWKFLKCGVVHHCRKYTTKCGVPQGGAISPMICNMALDGLEQRLTDSLQDIEFIRYADDILVLSPDVDKLGQAIGVINEFLSDRGLSLSKEKTIRTEASKGFSFLGWSIRTEKELPLIVADRSNVESLFEKARDIIFGYDEFSSILKELEPIIQGWAGYHKGVVPEVFLKDVAMALQDTIGSVNGGVSPSLSNLF